MYIQPPKSSDVPWYSGEPPGIGWWPCSNSEDPRAIRWWDGKMWSIAVYHHSSAEEAGKAATSEMNPFVFQSSLKWTHRWWEKNSVFETHAALIAQINKAKEEIAELARLFPSCFDENGKPIVATT